MKRGRPHHEDILTPREWEVLALVEHGHTNEEIGKRLGISATTAKFHVSQILAKLNLPNRREAGAWHIRRMPALLPLFKSGAWLAGTAAIAAVIYFGLGALLVQDSRAGATPMGKVAYVRNGDVWVKHLPNGPEEQLTRWGDVRGEPQWSASGEWLSVARDIPSIQPSPGGACCGPAGAPISIWVVDADGKRERQVEGNYMPMSWSPVKDEFAFSSHLPQPDNRQALLIEHADGSNRRIVVTGDDTYMAPVPFGWAPAGDWLIVLVMTGGRDSAPSNALIQVRPDGSGDREFYRFEVPECRERGWQAVKAQIPGPHNCPDSEYPDDEYVMSYGALTNSRLYAAVFSNLDALALPQNPILAIALGGSGNPMSGPSVFLTELSLAISEASGRLATTTDPEGSAPHLRRIAVFDLASGRLQYLSTPGDAPLHPAWSPDGGTLFFAALDGSSAAGGESADSAYRIWSMAADGSERQQLTNDPRYRDEYPRVTPDGTQLLFTRIDLGGEEEITALWLLDLPTGELTMVINDFDVLIPTQWHRVFDWWTPGESR